MEAFAAYLMKSAIWITGFAIIYFIFLRNERYFKLKRIYLISGILISFIFPLISFHYKVEVPAPVISQADMLNVTASAITVPLHIATGKPFDYRLILLFLYLSGILFLLFRIVRNFSSIFKTINKGKISNHGSAKLIRATQFPASFSFFNYVFINPSVSENEMEEIMNHEIVHVRQRHWFDLLLVEILRLIQWINPFAWIYTRFIRLNHEYLADQVALQRTTSPANYRAALMNQLFESPVISLSNSFNYSLNKKRFDMMKQIITSPYRKFKVLLVLPLFAIVFYAFATPEYHYQTQSVNPTGETAFATIEIPSPIPALKKEQNIKPEKTVPQDTSKLSVKIEKAMIGNPLVVINGIPSDRETLKWIDPKAIESISVLKDESSTALYGEKGKNGVILVTTKNAASVKGTVVQEDGKPIGGAYIGGTGTLGNAYGNISDANGRFTVISVQKDATLLVSCNGYLGQKLKPSFTSEMKIVMVKDPEFKSPVIQQEKPQKAIFVDGVFTNKSFPQINKDLGHKWGIVKSFSAKEGLEKYGEQGKNGGYDIITREKAIEMGLKPPYPRIDPEDYPTFKGQGHASFNDWLIGQIKYPDDAVTRGASGKVTASYTVNPDGTLSTPAIMYSSDKSLEDAVVKAIAASPQWEPPKNPESADPFKASVTIKFELPDRIYVPEEPFVVVEEMPMFPGGDEALLKFIAENTQYPILAKTNGITGRVIIRFVVSKEGLAQESTVLKGVDPSLDAEAIRVVNSLPVFKPGIQGGKPVPVYYMVPVTFSLAKDTVKTNP